MAIKFSCFCGRRFNALDKYAGRRTICPDCKREIEVPSIAPPVPEEASPPPIAPPAERRRLWQDPIVVIGTAVPSLILTAFFVYLSLPHLRAKPTYKPAVYAPPAPPPPPPPPPAFNPNDMHATFVWFLDARRRLGEDYKTAYRATINPLVEEPLARFAEKVREYKQALPRLKGERVNWPATVESIDKKGVKVRCVESDYIDPHATSTRADRYLLDVLAFP